MKAENENNIYGFPNMGCMLGTAYQVLVARLAAKLEKEHCDITVPEYMVLRALYSRDGMQQCEIGEMVGKDKGAVCRTVKSLETKGLVTTEQVSHKCLKVYISEKGRAVEPKIIGIAEEREKSLSEILTPEELSSFRAILTKIIKAKP